MEARMLLDSLFSLYLPVAVGGTHTQPFTRPQPTPRNTKTSNTTARPLHATPATAASPDPQQTLPLLRIPILRSLAAAAAAALLLAPAAPAPDVQSK